VTVAAVYAVQNGTHKPRTITISRSTASDGAKTSSSGAESAIAPTNTDFKFVLNGQLPALDGKQAAWRFASPPTIDQSAIARLANALGVSGTVATTSSGWQVGTNGGPTLFVAKAAGVPWTYSGGAAVMPTKSCSSAGKDPSQPNTTPAPPDCTAPPKPVGVPTADEAKAKALTLLDVAGIDHANATVTATENDGWSTAVQFVAKIDGLDVQSLSTRVSYAAQGAIEYATGYLAQPQKADSYPRLGTAAAFENLQANGVFGYGIAYATDVGTSGSGSASSRVTTGVAEASGPTRTVPMTPDGNGTATTSASPPDKPSEPTIRTVTITSVREALLTVVGADGSLWLVPGYLFIDSDGGQWPVLAIDKSYVTVTTPVPQIGTPATDGTAPTAGGSSGFTGSGVSTPPVSPKVTMVTNPQSSLTKPPVSDPINTYAPPGT
jgi:hypothetical protein